jgi:hypothetical protein
LCFKFHLEADHKFHKKIAIPKNKLFLGINILPTEIDPRAELSELRDGPFFSEMRGNFLALNSI